MRCTLQIEIAAPPDYPSPMEHVGIATAVVLAVAGSVLFLFSVVGWGIAFAMVLPLLLIAIFRTGARFLPDSWPGPF